jgi:fatty-acyl-CoA synthase
MLRQCYGLTEVAGPVTASSPDDAIHLPEQVGRGGVLARLAVVTPEGKPCAPDEVGEIVIKSPSLTTGYWNNPDLTAAAIVDGWLQTGDLGVFDEEGRLAIVGRLKDLIITGGINVTPGEVEAAIERLSSVHDVVVIGVPDDKFGEAIAAILFADRELTVEQVIAHCRQNLADYKVPSYVVLCESALPRLPMQKLDRVAIREQYGDLHRTGTRAR